MGVFKAIFKNTRKPEGLLGKWMVRSMNHAHAAIADWGMDHVPALYPTAIAELGCGGGRNAKELLRRFPEAKLTALDYSEVSVEKARQVNRQEIQRGHCHVIQGDVSHLPFRSGDFELVTAFETVYFWPGPTDSFREVYRVLKPGGIFLIVNETDGMRPFDNMWSSAIDGLHIFNKTQLSAFLDEAGFSSVTVDHDTAKHRLCILAVREA